MMNSGWLCSEPGLVVVAPLLLWVVAALLSFLLAMAVARGGRTRNGTGARRRDMSMFKINPAPTFFWVTNVTQPGLDEPAALELEFKHKDSDALKVLMASVEGRQDMDILAEVVVGWRNVVDDAGKPLAFSLDALGQLVKNYPASPGEIYQAYLRGAGESRQKN